MNSLQTKSVRNIGELQLIPLGKHPNGSGDDLIKVLAGHILLGFAKTEAEAFQLFNKYSYE